MKFATKFLIIISSLIFAVVALDKGQLHSMEEDDDDDSGDCRRLQQLSDCKIVKLKAGDFELLPNETLKVEAFNLTLNKTFFDVTNDSATICKPYYLDSTDSNFQIFPYFPSTFCLLVCLFLFATLDYDQLYWATFAVPFGFYTLIAITKYVKGFFDTNEFKIPHDLHFMFLQFFFWMSTITSDALMLTPADERSRKRSPRKRITTLDLRRMIRFCFCRLFFVLTFFGVLEVIHSRLRDDAIDNLFQVLIMYGSLSLFNLVSVQISLRVFGFVEMMQIVLKELFVVSFIFFNIIGVGLFLQYYCIKGLDTCRRSAFQLESAVALTFVAAGVLKYYLCSSVSRKPAIVEKVTQKLKIAVEPKQENLELEIA